ncbi:Sperm associated antigen 1 [Chytridiales sp. JEL 0842]|nr:Sperm associated antigen 1 [Chytridiales sp. JEL 0842]
MAATIAPNDIKSLMNTMNPAGDTGAEDVDVAPDAYDVEQLDFAYVAKCKDPANLRKLLAVLRSGKEGYYPELERAFENKIEQLDPTFNDKRHDVQKPAYNELEELTKDLFDWQSNVKLADTKLRSAAKKAGQFYKPSAPTVRNSSVSNSNASKESQKDLLTVDYQSSGTLTDTSIMSDEDLLSSAMHSTAEVDSDSSPSHGSPSDSPTGTRKSQKHVRFADEVEAAQKANQRRIQAQQRREKRLAKEQEAAMAAQAKKKKRRSHKKKSSSSSSESLNTLVDSETLSTAFTKLASVKDENEAAEESTPPVAIEVTPTESADKKSTPIKSTDYRAWDRLDVDEIVKTLDVEEPKVSPSAKTTTSKARITPYKPEGAWVPSIEDPAAVATSYQEAEFLAEMEKNKGNDAFKAGDYQDAVDFYTRSLKLVKRANLYTNRAVAYLKIKEYQKAEDDATAAIEMNDPQFLLKAYLRRAAAREKRGKYIDALQDLDEALRLSPNHKEALQLRADVQKKYADFEGERAIKTVPPKKKKMVIEEVDEIIEEIETPMFRANRESYSKKVEEREAPDEQSTNMTTGVKHQPDANASLSLGEERSDTRSDLLQTLKDELRARSMADLKEEADEVLKEPKVQTIPIEEVEDDSDEEDSVAVELHSTVVDTDEKAAEVVDVSRPNIEDRESSSDASEVALEVPGSPPKQIESTPRENVEETARGNTQKSEHKFDQPQNSIEFENAWRSLKSDASLWADYVSTIPIELLVKFVGNSVNPSVLPSVFSALSTLIDTKGSMVMDILMQLKGIQRIGISLCLLTKSDRKVLAELVAKLTTKFDGDARMKAISAFFK